MSALNLGSITRAPAPLVWRAAEGVYGWVEQGLGFILFTATGRWQPLGVADAALASGRVLGADERVALVATYGRPLTCTWCGEDGVHAECVAAEREAEYRRREDKADRRRFVAQLDRDARRFGSEALADLATLVRRGS